MYISFYFNQACIVVMANPEHIAKLKEGVEAWNKWREENRKIVHDLIGAKLSEAKLSGANVIQANLSEADLIEADLRDAQFYETVIANVDLSKVAGLEEISHYGPSIIDHRTLANSGELPDVFLRGIGLPDNFIEYIPSLFGSGVAIQLYSCFISHSTKDEAFARRLYADLQAEGVRCWYAPEEMKGGAKLHTQINEAIRLHDKLVLILSEHSMNSDWVTHEIRRTRKHEKAEGKQKLFPISITPFENIEAWELFAPETVTDLADEIRGYFIPDFSNWKQDHDSYQKAFGQLLKGLRQDEGNH